MVAPVVGKAWQCTFCNKVYSHNPQGEKLALCCCTCSTCGDSAHIHYVGGCVTCARCQAIANLEYAKKNLEAAKATLASAEKAIEPYRRSDVEGTQRQRVLGILSNYDIHFTASEIATMTDIGESVVVTLLSKMTRDGQIERVGRGSYRAKREGT